MVFYLLFFSFEYVCMKESVCTNGWPRTCNVDQAGLQFSMIVAAIYHKHALPPLPTAFYFFLYAGIFKAARANKMAQQVKTCYQA